MYLVYTLDHLFQSTRVSNENSSVTKTFHFSNLISTQDFFFHPTCNIQSHILKFQPFTTFKVQGSQTKTHLLQRHFIFLTLFQLKTFFPSNMQHSKPHTEISTLSDFVCYYSCI